ncbi:hypothetical protein [Sulfobacillus harzensis]|nr:hypothetical protein [Sulfobacillus harzensis]
MSESVERLSEAFHRLPDSDQRAFLERLEEGLVSDHGPPPASRMG